MAARKSLNFAENQDDRDTGCTHGRYQNSAITQHPQVSTLELG